MRNCQVAMMTLRWTWTIAEVKANFSEIFIFTARLRRSEIANPINIWICCKPRRDKTRNNLHLYRIAVKWTKDSNLLTAQPQHEENKDKNMSRIIKSCQRNEVTFHSYDFATEMLNGLFLSFGWRFCVLIYVRADVPIFIYLLLYNKSLVAI